MLRSQPPAVSGGSLSVVPAALVAALAAGALPAGAQTTTERPLLDSLWPASEVTSSIVLDGDALLGVQEADVGRDLDGDGDLDDVVQHLFLDETGALVDLGLVGLHYPSDSEGGVYAAVGLESELGDLNGDGDTQDRAPFLADRGGAAPIYLGFASGAPIVGNGLVLAPIDEATQGEDLNGDGDLLDQRLALGSLATGASVLLPFEPEKGFLISTDRVEFELDEDDGVGLPVDWNRDGDVEDVVVLVLDLERPALDVLPFAVGPTGVPVAEHRHAALRGETKTVLLVVDEVAQGADVDGDGQLEAGVVIAWDPVARRVLATHDRPFLGFVADLAPFPLWRSELVAFRSSEALAGQDFNGDGDLDDEPVQVWSEATGRFHDTGLDATTVFSTADGTLLLVGDEATTGLSNGDADATDTLLAHFDPRTGVTTAVPAAIDDVVAPIAVDGTVYFALSEADNAGGPFAGDRTGDGDETDRVVAAYDVASGTLVDAGLALRLVGYGLDWTGTAILAECGESNQGADLDGSGALDGSVLQVLAPRTLARRGLATPLAEAGARTLVLGDAEHPLVVSVDEARLGGDLNGDGDTGDVVAARVRIR